MMSSDKYDSQLNYIDNLQPILVRNHELQEKPKKPTAKEEIRAWPEEWQIRVNVDSPSG